MKNTLEFTRQITPWIVGALFVASAIAKASSAGPTEFVLDYVFVTRLHLSALAPAVEPFVWLLVTFEIILGGWLLSGIAPIRARRVAILTLSAFTLFLVALTLDPAAPPCSCGGWIRLAADARTENLISFGKDLVLLAALFAAGDGARPSSNSIASELSSSPPPAA